jgi:hypothetical protein
MENTMGAPLQIILEIKVTYADNPQANTVEQLTLEQLPKTWQRGFQGIIDSPEFVDLSFTVGLTSVNIRPVDEEEAS